MQYRDDKKSGNSLSILGYGCMRLPGGLGRVDMEKSTALIKKAYEQGVNYFDTAYIYPGIENAVGKILENLGIREKVYVATKLPHAVCKSKNDFDKYFDEQKRRLRTDYIDYYLVHNISEFKQWANLCNLGFLDWVAEKIASGEIRRLGFSYHGSKNDFIPLLDAFDWDFVQIQYNYININYQAGQTGLLYAAEKGIPVMIMEPLLGGKLVSGLPKDALKIMKNANPEATPAGWGLRWLWNQPGVTVVLSGMNDMAQLDENLMLADDSVAGMLNSSEENAIQKVIGVFNESYRIRCTGCSYCMPCPQNINIPDCFAAYNTSYAISWFTGEMNYMTAAGITGEKPRFAGDCVKCGKCEKHCPQGIEIRKELKRVKRRFEIPGTKIAIWVLTKFMS